MYDLNYQLAVVPSQQLAEVIELEYLTCTTTKYSTIN